MADNRYLVEHAKTSKSKCKDAKCKETIEKDQLRIGKISPNPFSEDDTMTSWYHPACIFRALKRAKASTKKIESKEDIENFEQLNEAEQQVIFKLMEESKTQVESQSSKPNKKIAGDKNIELESSKSQSVSSGSFTPISAFFTKKQATQTKKDDLAHEKTEQSTPVKTTNPHETDTASSPPRTKSKVQDTDGDNVASPPKKKSKIQEMEPYTDSLPTSTPPVLEKKSSFFYWSQQSPSASSPSSASPSSSSSSSSSTSSSSSPMPPSSSFPKSSPALSSSSSLTPFLWQWHDGEEWINFHPIDSKLLSLMARPASISFTTSKLSFNKKHQTIYSFNFKKMRQTNTETNQCRRIRGPPPSSPSRSSSPSPSSSPSTSFSKSNSSELALWRSRPLSCSSPWVSFAPVDSAFLATAQAAGVMKMATRNLSFNTEYQTLYEFDLVSDPMTQKNTESGSIREVQACESPSKSSSTSSETQSLSLTEVKDEEELEVFS
eukprot:gb/GEZN01005465.1/.p1 GENE.gb/GEZN01005465.1/~~gb/GEZN01005465.1/.p1  ORF type:complete len:492 (+),score=80.53 gb/GEZN01005465.1/:26-1501(+)